MISKKYSDIASACGARHTTTRGILALVDAIVQKATHPSEEAAQAIVDLVGLAPLLKSADVAIHLNAILDDMRKQADGYTSLELLLIAYDAAWAGASPALRANVLRTLAEDVFIEARVDDYGDDVPARIKATNDGYADFLSKSKSTRKAPASAFCSRLDEKMARIKMVRALLSGMGDLAYAAGRERARDKQAARTVFGASHAS